MSFKLWSDLNNDAFKNLKPDLGYRFWADLSEDEKKRIWKYLEFHFFDDTINSGAYHQFSTEEGYYFNFRGQNYVGRRERINFSISGMYHLYKYKAYTTNFLKEATHFAACKDFYSIFIKQDGDAVLELISLYCQALLNEREKDFFGSISDYKSKEEYENKKSEYIWAEFDEFANDLNNVFGDFGVSVYLTRNGFIPKQEEKIITEIYEPVIKCLADSKWEKVNNLLSDAFVKYRENTPSGYSTCVTHTVAAVEAFLQIVVKGKTGEGDFAGLVSEGQRKSLIPDDMFTKDMFKTIISILMRERKETGDAHVKESYATERNSKMVLNLAMVFIQHCILI